ncbi:hypothetical protein SHI21_16655 [Bacteriovorax sp. PP10]|uniref:Lipoprotein n=1 Tax=Bacteriovorax antarcticus TaxID=3088717 RepID=A0ABU5VZR8_9BACT|nr:hypothetical protein [Bacteriovorax sp. PP10]MEA9357863.1 hypothetical protein [Bacteriovorax sp. PP10]
MKKSLILLSLLLSFTANAKNMARTEKADDVYKEQADGSVVYVGKCSIHPDKVGINYLDKETLVEYFDSDYGRLSREEFLKKTAVLETALTDAGGLRTGSEMPIGIDDFTADKIESTTFKGLDLFRLNIGVGGGNGMILIYNRKVLNGKPVYELMAEMMDGDLEYCDSKVWLSK